MNSIDKIRGKLKDLDGAELNLLLSIINDYTLDIVVAELKYYLKKEIEESKAGNKHLFQRNEEDIAYGKKKLAEIILTRLEGDRDNFQSYLKERKQYEKKSR